MTPKHGNHLRYDISITKKEAEFGGPRIIEIEKFELCESCKGTGKGGGLGFAKCKLCNGEGETLQKCRIKFNVPAGVQHQQRLRAIGMGEPGLGGGNDGDLFVIPHIEDSPA